MAKLTAKQRENIPSSEFALKDRRFPINDKNHARAAIMLSNKGTTPKEGATVRSKARAILKKKKGGIISKLRKGGQGYLDKTDERVSASLDEPISKLRRGGIAQGKSPGVDTATTIDGTTYYKKGGMAKGERGKKYATGGEVEEEGYESKKALKKDLKSKAKRSPNVKRYKLKKATKVKDESAVTETHTVLGKGKTKRSLKLPLGKKSKRKYNLPTASTQYYAETVPEKKKSTPMLLKKGGKYKKGGLINKVKYA